MAFFYAIEYYFCATLNAPMKKLLITLLFLSVSAIGFAQVGKTSTVMVTVTPNSDGTITLNWPSATFTGNWQIFKRKTMNDAWPSSATATLASSLNTWKDASFKSGESWEYALYQVNGSNQAIAIGNVYAGNKTTEIPSFGSMILLIDSNFIKPLSSEINILKNDLAANGWLVYTLYAGRNEKPNVVRDRVKSKFQSLTPAPRSLYILGHVPVPYSGMFRNIDSAYACAYPPDGHIEGSGNHTGAWPADLYYADIDGSYTDNNGPVKTGGDSRNWNLPGDGKYDQCKVAEEVLMEVGRVDLAKMPVFGQSDTLLVRKYLNRAHLWRKDSLSYVERGLIDDNFTGLILARTGWLTLNCMIPKDSIFNNRDYFTSQNKENYLWSYGCGAGSYTSCSGIGVTSDFNPAKFNNIFTALAGSFFGDWDVNNSLLRAPLGCGSLCSFWGGIPTWFTHYMGLGMPIGHAARYTQNSKIQDFNGSENDVNIALMGDPTMRVRNVPSAGKLNVADVSSKVQLNWGKAKGKFDGYCVYRVDSSTNTWTRVNASIITDTFYTDAANWVSGKYKYAVRAIRLETNPSGSWYNLGAASFGWINHVNAISRLDAMEVKVYPNPNSGSVTIALSEAANGAVSIAVTDMAGRLVWETSKLANGNSITADLPVSNGTYIITCTANGKSGSSRITVNR